MPGENEKKTLCTKVGEEGLIGEGVWWRGGTGELGGLKQCDFEGLGGLRYPIALLAVLKRDRNKRGEPEYTRLICLERVCIEGCIRAMSVDWLSS